jgi:TatD DNase family protein
LLSLTDSHCHLDFGSFDPDRESVLARAINQDIQHIINPGITIATSQVALRLARKYKGLIYASVGIHPNEGIEWTDNSIDELREMTGTPEVVAIGEIGLDYYRNRLAPELQRKIFCKQLELAASLDLPVIIHNRQATADTLDIIRDWVTQLKTSNSSLLTRPGVFHSFSGGIETAQCIIDMNFYVGIGGPVTFKNSGDQQGIVKKLPLDRILLETDAPFLAPHPHRGQRNEPAYLTLVAEKISELHQVDFRKVAEITSHNAYTLFSWSSSIDNTIL